MLLLNIMHRGRLIYNILHRCCTGVSPYSVSLPRLRNGNSILDTHRLCAASVSSATNVNPDEPKDPKASTSFVMNMFCGELQADFVFPYPNSLTEDQRHTLSMSIGPAEHVFQEQIDSVFNDEKECVDEKSREALKTLGAYGLQVPESLGGSGLNNTQYGRVTEIVGAHDLGIGIHVGAHQSIGFKGILLFGTDAQKAKYLPRLAGGEELAAFALTEPAVGSDASGIKCKAELSDDGKHYIMNGSKIWISNGGVAEVFTVFAQTTKKGETSGPISAFIVERGFGGVSSGPPEKKLGIKASNTAEVFFDDVKIPIENIIGGVGDGFKIAMNILNNGRFGMATCLSGTMKTCINKAVEHATNRSQFGNKIYKYGAIQEKIARMTMKHYITESTAYMLSASMDQGAPDYQLEAAISKVFASESAWYCVDEAIQILGGAGFMKATGLERFMRDLRIFRIFEGTNDILRLFVALTGMQFAGKRLEELGKALKNPASNIGGIIGAGQKRAKRMMGLSSGPSLSQYAHSDLSNSANLVSKSIDEFGGTVESLLLKYKKGIIEEQFILKRVADAAIDIYGMVAVLSRASRALNESHSSSTHEKLLCTVICEEGYASVHQNLQIATSSSSKKLFNDLSQISDNVIDHQGLVQPHPLML